MNRPIQFKGKFCHETYNIDRLNLLSEIERNWRKGRHRIKPEEGVSISVFWEHGKMPSSYYSKLRNDVLSYKNITFGDDFKLVLDIGNYFTVISLDFIGF